MKMDIVYLIVSLVVSICWFITSRQNKKNKFWKDYYFNELRANEKMIRENGDKFNKIISKHKRGIELLDTASWLVGSPATNISSSTDLACDKWQEDYAKFKSDFLKND